MAAAAFDTLSVARELEAAGIGRAQAEAIAQAINHSDERGASKAGLETAVAGLETRLRADLTSKADDLRDAVAGLASKADLEAAVAGLATRSELHNAVADLTSKADLRDAVAGLASKAGLEAAVAGLATRSELSVVRDAIAGLRWTIVLTCRLHVRHRPSGIRPALTCLVATGPAAPSSRCRTSSGTPSQSRSPQAAVTGRFRRLGLGGTELARAQCGTVREKVLKVGAEIRLSVRKVWLSMSESDPRAEWFRRILARLQAIPLRCSAIGVVVQCRHRRTMLPLVRVYSPPHAAGPSFRGHRGVT